MPPSNIRKEARDALKGNWGKAVCLVLAYTLISFVIGLVESLIGEGTLLCKIIDLAYAIISVPLSFGLIISFMKLKRGENFKVFGFLKDGLSRFGKSWGIAFHTFIRLLLPMICMILIAVVLIYSILYGIASYLLAIILVILYIATLIYTISRSFLYILAYQIGYDNPELSSKDCVKKSESLMKGNRGNYLLLELSFIGWTILAALPLGIGMLWLMPYMAIAEVCFYEKVAKI